MAVDQLRVRIDPGLPERPAPGPARQLSSDAAEHLEQAAETSNDPELGASLRNIAKRRR